MKLLAKLGFTQSYTYFTWKNTAIEAARLEGDVLNAEALSVTCGNLFANTPDILHEYSQRLRATRRFA